MIAGTQIYHKGRKNGKSVYIAGPMSGYPEFNFPAFFEAQNNFENHGWAVWNPANKDAEADVQANESFATGDAKKLMASGWNFREVFLWDVEKVINSDAIFMLRGWQYSPGAVAEHAVAVVIKKNYPDYEIMYQSE
jgi:hypothetical protein